MIIKQLSPPQNLFFNSQNRDKSMLSDKPITGNYCYLQEIALDKTLCRKFLDNCYLSSVLVIENHF